MTRVNGSRLVVLGKTALAEALKSALESSPFKDSSIHILPLVPMSPLIYVLIDYVKPDFSICDTAAYMKWCQQYLNVTVALPELPLYMTAININISTNFNKSIYCIIRSAENVFFEFN